MRTNLFMAVTGAATAIVVGCTGELTTASRSGLVIEESTATALRGTLDEGSVRYRFESLAAGTTLDVALLDAATGAERLRYRADLDLPESVELSFEGHTVDPTDIDALTRVVRSAEAEALPELGAKLAAQGGALAASTPAQNLLKVALQLGESVGMTLTMTDEEMRIAATSSVDYAQQPAHWDSIGDHTHVHCRGKCGYGCPGEPTWFSLCGADFLFGSDNPWDCWDNYCYQHDGCCYYYGWGACVTWCLVP